MNYNYFYGAQAESYSFIRVPRLLMTGEEFKGLSTDAKLLYALLLDRMGLLVKKGGIAVLYTMEFTPLKNLIRERRNIEILKQERTEAGGLTPMIFILRVKE